MKNFLSKVPKNNNKNKPKITKSYSVSSTSNGHNSSDKVKQELFLLTKKLQKELNKTMYVNKWKMTFNKMLFDRWSNILTDIELSSSTQADVAKLKHMWRTEMSKLIPNNSSDSIFCSKKIEELLDGFSKNN
jgi:hypothetical protein